MIAEHQPLLELNFPLAPVETKPDVKRRNQTDGRDGFNRIHRIPHFKRKEDVRRAAFDDEQDQRDMARLAAGCDDALEDLMQRHTKRLFGHLMRILRDKMEAQESLLEAFVRVYRHREHFDPNAKFSTWLYTIASNLARDRLRRRARQPEFISLEASDDHVERQSAEPGERQSVGRRELENVEEILLASERPPDLALEDDEWRHSLANAIASLPETLRQPLVLFAEDDKSQAEIAAEMRCTVKAVEMRLYHARKHLQSRLKRKSKSMRDCLACDVIR